MKLTNSMIISLISLILLFILGAWKGVDVSIPIVSVTTAYVIGRAGEKSAMVYSASVDRDCNTSEVIDKLK